MFPKIKLQILIWFAKLGYLLNLPIPPIPAVCCIIKKGNKILAIDLSYRKGLSLPGGGLKFNETFEEGLIREVKEETGLDIYDLSYLSSHKYVSPEKLSHVSICFLAKVKNIKNIRSSDEGKVLWVTPKQLYQRAVYKDVKKHLSSLL